MADESISFRITVDGADQAAAALDKTTEATKRTDVAAQQFTRSTGQARAGLQAAAQATQALGGQLSAVNPVLGSAVGALGQMATGAGAAAVGVGLVTAALVAVGQSLYDSTQRINVFADRLVSATDNLYSFVTAARAAREAQANLNQLLSGVGSAEDQGALLRGLQARAYGLSIQAQDRGPDSFAAQQLREVQAQILRTQANIRNGPRGVVSEEESSYTEIEDIAPLTGRAAQDAARDLGYAVDRRGRMASNDNARRGGGARRVDSSWMDSGVAGKRADQAAAAAAEEAAAAEVERENRRMQGLYELAQREAEARDELREGQREKERQAHEDRLSELEEWGAAGERVGAALYDAFELVASGQATLAQAAAQLFKQSLQQFAKSEMLEAGKEIGLALGSLAMENYPGAAKHFASAAQHGLVAAAAGVGAAAIGGASAGGGGARGNARPESAGRGGAGGGYGGPATIVVNLPANTILAGTYADAGREIIRATRAASRTYGVAA